MNSGRQVPSRVYQRTSTMVTHQILTGISSSARRTDRQVTPGSASLGGRGRAAGASRARSGGSVVRPSGSRPLVSVHAVSSPLPNQREAGVRNQGSGVRPAE